MDLRIKQLIILFVIALIFFVPTFVKTNPPLAGMDTYFFLNHIYEKYDDGLKDAPFLGKIIFNSLPANMLVLKIIMFIFCFLSIVIFSEIGKLYSKNYGWLSGALLFTGFYFGQIFFRLEDDLFGLPVLFLGWLLIAKMNEIYDRDKYTHPFYLIGGLGLIIISVFIWKFAVFFLFALFFTSYLDKKWRFQNLYWLVIIPVILIYHKILFGAIIPNSNVSENTFFFAMGIFSLCVIIFAYAKNFRIERNWITILIFTALTIINFKFIIVLYPFLVLNIVNGLEKIAYKQRNLMILFLCLIFLLITINNFNAIPSKHHYELLGIHQSYNKLNNTNYKEDVNWGFGWFYIFMTGKETQNFRSYRPTPNEGLIMTYKNDSDVNHCELVFENLAGEVRLCQ